MDDIAKILFEESDRGCAIFAAAIVDNALTRLIKTTFRQEPDVVKKVVVPLFGRFGPLCTFAARIDLAFAMKLIPRDVYTKLNLIRKLRNEFAHEEGFIDFEDSRCQDRLMRIIEGINPFFKSEEPDQLKVFGHQILSVDRFNRRMSFALAISKLQGTLDACRVLIEHGMAPSDVLDKRAKISSSVPDDQHHSDDSH